MRISTPHNEPFREFEGALGHFVIQFTQTELTLYAVLLSYAGIEEGVGRAIFSGTRASVMCTLIRAIMENCPSRFSPARVKDLDLLLSHLVSINGVRDKIVHNAQPYATIKEDKHWQILHNQTRAKRAEGAYYESITADTVDSMSYDLTLIAGRLKRHLLRKDELIAHDLAQPLTWRYRPLPQGAKSQRREKTPQLQQRPPSASGRKPKE